MTPNLQAMISSPKIVGCASQPFPDVPEQLLDGINEPAPKKAQDWKCTPSKKSLRTTNPIRVIVDPIVANGIQSGEERGDGKDPISLALGDPTVGSSLSVCTIAMNAAVQAIQSPGHAAGYVPACGTIEARTAIAHYHSFHDHTVSPDNAIVANGCSGALELVLTALLDDDSILLVPKPGFPLYQVIAESHGATVAHYNLDPYNNWEIDLEHMESLINDNVRGIVINNPSNPTGSVYSEQHLRAILDVCDRYHLPIIADEVYGDLAFGDNQYISMAQVMIQMGRKVPVIVTSGLAKQYLLPGWRVGWAVFYDSDNHALRPVLEGATRLAQVILGASHLAQSVIPALLTPQDSEQLTIWKLNLKQTLETQAMMLCRDLSKCHGLTVYNPQGSMYAIVQIHLDKFCDIANDMDFTKKLLKEENVFVLPGQAFNFPGVFRVVYCASPHILQDASTRISNFCQRHAL